MSACRSARGEQALSSLAHVFLPLRGSERALPEVPREAGFEDSCAVGEKGRGRRGGWAAHTSRAAMGHGQQKTHVFI